MQVKYLRNSVLSAIMILCIFLITAKCDIEKSKLMMIENCRRIEDATDLDVERFLEHKASRGINSKCFIACVFEHLGIVQRSKIEIEVLRKIALEEHTINQKPNDPIFDIIEECQEITYPDRCLLASQLKDCLDKSSAFHKKHKNNGILFP